MRARLTAVVLACAISILSPAYARDNGQWTQVNPDLRGWFDSLRNQRGVQCCSFADGLSIDDPDWDMKDRSYRVRIKGEWIVVPPENLVVSPNKIGRAVVWPYEEGGRTLIRCFIPGVEG